MKSSIQRFLGIISILAGLMLFVWGWIHFFLLPSDGLMEAFELTVLISGILWIILSMAALRFGPSNGSLLLSMSSVSALYLLVEFIFYVLVTFGFYPSQRLILDGSFGVFSKPCAVYDSLAGYRWTEGPIRIAKVLEGEVVFDTKFSPNNRGMISNTDYTREKKDSMTKRYIVFGDSFTASEFNEDYWPDITQRKFNNAGINIELYSFAVDGGGLVNWHNILFNEIIPYYEFDGIILAVFGDDLDRNFMIMHADSAYCHAYRFETIPDGLSDFKANYLPDAKWGAPVESDRYIDSMLNIAMQSSWEFAPLVPELSLLHKIHDAVKQLDIKFREQHYDEKYRMAVQGSISSYSFEQFSDRYGEHKLNLIDTMLSWCNANSKLIITASVPDEAGLRYVRDGGFNSTQTECLFFANEYQGIYFDGYLPFQHIQLNELRSYYLKHDIHWNLKGSTVFAEAFADSLIKWYDQGDI